MFRPDQLVVCVDDRTPEQRGIVQPLGGSWVGSMGGLKRGCIYTVRQCADTRFFGPCVWLREIVRPPQGADSPEVWGVTAEPGFMASRFRPLDDSKLSIFREMLAPSPDVIAEYVMEDDTARIDAAAEAITRSISG